MIYKFNKKPEVVAGIQWNGYNLFEVERFLGYGGRFPNSEEGWVEYSRLQEQFREEGYPVRGMRKFVNVATVDSWIVKYSDGSYGIMPDEEVRDNYILEEDI